MQKKRYSLLIALALVLCLSFLPTAAFAAEGVTHTVSESLTFEQALEKAQAGDTIALPNGYEILTEAGNELTPFIIDKAVTITGNGTGTLSVRRAGLLLEADVKFQDISLQWINNCYDAVFANGYTLTMENVSCTSRQVDLFGGNLYVIGQADGEVVSTAYSQNSGEHGKIIICGTNSGFGNIYAGSMNGSFAQPVSISLGSDIQSGGTRGTEIYASGAMQGLYNSEDWFSFAQPAPPAPDANGDGSVDYPVLGAVSIEVSTNAPTVVDGETGGETNAAVTFRGEEAVSYRLSMRRVDTLHAVSDVLQPAALNEDVNLSIAAGAELNLSRVIEDDGSFTVGSFTGGESVEQSGILAMDWADCLEITGNVSGVTHLQTTAQRLSQETSGKVLIGHTYLVTPEDTPESVFSFTPHEEQSEVQLTREGTNWTASLDGFTAPQVKPVSFEIEETEVSADIFDGIAAVAVTYEVGDEEFITDVPLHITIQRGDDTYTATGGYELFEGEEYGQYYYSCPILCMELMYLDINSDTLAIQWVNGVASGEYTVTVAVELADESTATDSFTLTIECDHDGGEATCTEWGCCEVCGEAYIEPDGHYWSQYDWAYDATHHWKNCTNCGTANEPIAHDFSNGDCICGKDAPVVTPEHVCEWEDDWSKNATHHWRACINAVSATPCNKITDYAEHRFDAGRCIWCRAVDPTYQPPGEEEPWTPPTYEIQISDTISNGTVTASPEMQEERKAVCLTMEAEAGYILSQLWVDGVDVTANVTFDDRYTFAMPAHAVAVDAKFVPVTSETQYRIRLTDGPMTANYTTAKPGTIVTITLTPQPGLALETMTIVDQNGNHIPWTGEDNVYRFEMPASKVTISVGLGTVKYTVSFDTLGYGEIPDQTITHGMTAQRPTDPVREGYVLSGWAWKNLLYDFTQPVTSDIELKALWNVKIFSVRFQDEAGNQLSEMQTIPYLGKVDRPQQPTKEGYVFLGWFDQNNTLYDFSTFVTDDITLTGRWAVAYNVTILKAENGYMKADWLTAAEGTTVTLDARPDSGFQIKTVTVTDALGDRIAVSPGKTENYFTFVMPNSCVTVSVEFCAKTAYLVELADRDEDYVQVRVTAQTAQGAAARVMLAAYDSNGRMVSLYSGTMTTDSLTARLEISQQVCSVKAFVLASDTLMPLCEAWTYELTV